MNPSMGQKMTAGDSFYQTDERLLFEMLTPTAEIVGHGYLLRQKSQNISREKTHEYFDVLGELKLTVEISWVESRGSQLDCILELPGGLLKKTRVLTLSLEILASGGLEWSLGNNLFLPFSLFQVILLCSQG